MLRRASDHHDADDLHGIITALATGPVDLFASSGGAVNALGFLGGEYGQAGDPDTFAAKLREVLKGG